MRQFRWIIVAVFLLALCVNSYAVISQYTYPKIRTGQLYVGTSPSYNNTQINSTGLLTLSGGATLNNYSSTSVLNLTETTVRVTGAFDVTGGLTTDTNALAIADTTGVLTLKSGAVIDNNASATVLNLTETTVRVTGGLDVTAGFTTDTNALAIADTTGVVTLKSGATIDNNADAAVLNLTETTIRATGILDVTGAAVVAGTLTSDATVTTEGNGAIVAGKGTVVEGGVDPIHKSVFTFTLTAANDIDVADGGKSAGVKIYDLPEGRILILGATINASVVTNNVYNASTNDIYYVSIGTVDGTQAADADLTGTEADIIPKTTLDTVSSTTLTTAWTGALAASAHFDGTTTPVDLFVNVAVPDASNTEATTHAITGTVTITWINLGDY